MPQLWQMPCHKLWLLLDISVHYMVIYPKLISAFRYPCIYYMVIYPSSTGQSGQFWDLALPNTNMAIYLPQMWQSALYECGNTQMWQSILQKCGNLASTNVTICFPQMRQYHFHKKARGSIQNPGSKNPRSQYPGSQRLREVEIQEVKIREVKIWEIKILEVKIREVKIREVEIQEVKIREVKNQEVKINLFFKAPSLRSCRTLCFWGRIMLLVLRVRDWRSV